LTYPRILMFWRFRNSSSKFFFSRHEGRH